MGSVRHLLRASLYVALGLLTPVFSFAAGTPDLHGRWKRNLDLSQDAVSKVFASLSLEGNGFTPDEQRFHDALLHFAKAIDRLQIEQTAEDVKIVLSGDDVQIFYPGGSRVRQGVLGDKLEVLAHYREDELVIQEKSDFGKLVQTLSLNKEGRLYVLLSLDDRRMRAPLLLVSVYDRAPGP